MLHTTHCGLFAMSVDMNQLAKCVSLCIFDLQGGFTLGKNVVKAKTTGSLEFFFITFTLWKFTSLDC
ncbi:hypothetical protein EUGRSUZ_E04339 [Eucalyptus grandis]|uniref:Uncharacterized protein n=2 Tax=Eucalyptus grandis TaxID=71139 RepID=A0A059CCD6_EUCGR|nr:hypothetical protein EUGRSUZ_E04339 [Eucalyptus grandis]